MPKIEITRNTQRLPSTIGTPRAGTSGTEISQVMSTALSNMGQAVGAAGQRTSQALDNISGMITQEVQKSQEKSRRIQDANYLSNAMVDANEEILRFEQEFKKNSADNPAGFANAYIEQVDSIYNDYINGATSPEVRRQLQQQFAAQRTNKFKNALSFESETIKHNFITDSEANLNVISNRLVEDPSLLVQSQAEINTIVEASKEVLDSKAHAKFKEYASETLINSTVRGLASQGDYDQAEAFLSNDNVKSLLNAEEVSRLKDSLERDKQANLRQVEKEQSIEYNNFIDNVKLNIIKGNTTETELLNYLDKGSFRSPDDYLKLKRILESTREKEDKNVKDIQRVDLAITSGQPLNPASKSDRNKADVYYNNVIVPTTAPEDLQERAIGFIQSIGVVPEGIKSNWVANLYNGTPQNKVGTALTIDKLINSTPTITRSFTEKELATARRISTGINAGMTPVEVIKAEEERIRLAPQIVNQRLAALQDIETDIDGELTSIFRDDPNEYPEAMRADYDSMIASLVVDFGLDADDAIDLANKRIEGTWGRSGITGEQRYMRHAPELYYGVPGKDNDWIKEQFEKDIEPFGELEDVKLRVDMTSDMSSPEYIIVHKVQGFEIPLVDEEGRVITWNPDYNDFHQGKVEEVRKEREEFLKQDKIEKNITSFKEGF